MSYVKCRYPDDTYVRCPEPFGVSTPLETHIALFAERGVDPASFRFCIYYIDSGGAYSRYDGSLYTTESVSKIALILGHSAFSDILDAAFHREVDFPSVVSVLIKGGRTAFTFDRQAKYFGSGFVPPFVRSLFHESRVFPKDPR